jgi:hypothetical protein
MKNNRRPDDQHVFDWLLFGLAGATLLVLSMADLKQAGTQVAQSSVFRTVR